MTNTQQTTPQPQPIIVPNFANMSINQRIAYHVDNILAGNIIKTMQEDVRSMWIYNNDEEKGYFTMDAENRIMKYGSMNSVINMDANTTAMKNNILMNLKGRTMIKRKDFDSLPGYINLLNGVLQLDGRILHQHDPKYNFKGVMNIKYNEDATCPKWIAFLTSAISYRDILELQKWFGYHLIKGQPHQILMILFGVEKSGKTQILRALREIVGSTNTSSNSLQELCDIASHASDNIAGKLANVCADMGNKKIYDISKVKQITGGDPIFANPKNLKPFEHLPNAKLSFGCNKLPDLSMSIEEDAAWWRRVRLIRFERTIPERERDIFFYEHVIESELSGIFNWMLDGYEILQKERFLEQESYILWQNTVRETNPLIEFYELFDKDSNGVVEKEFVRQIYEQWCYNNKTIPLSTTKFGIYFNKLHVESDRRRIIKGGDKVYVWLGIKLSVRTMTVYTK